MRIQLQYEFKNAPAQVVLETSDREKDKINLRKTMREGKLPKGAKWRVCTDESKDFIKATPKQTKGQNEPKKRDGKGKFIKKERE